MPADGAPRRARIGVDIGGTFTDLVLLVDGLVAGVGKALTTPADPSVAVAAGVERLLAEVDPARVGEVVHGTTLVANALIERKGAVTCLLTTRGARDALAIRREHRYDLYDLFLELPEPLVPRRRRWEVDERVLADGTVDRPLDEAEVRRLARRARREGVQAAAICFLHAYAHPDHERRAAAVLAEELPGVPVSASSDVVPELGEYVRASTTVANAYVRPLMDRYLATLDHRLRDAGLRAPLHLMLSTGGLATVETGRRHPVRLTESGPAGGALSAAFAGAAAGERDVLGFDMGGTTAKACLVEGGEPLLAREHEVARVYRFAPESGLPLRVPVIDLIEIGAGGGSVARVDRFGLPKVGPESAGAEPGPACYGRGGDRPTVTDADLLLGYLDPRFFLGGEMPLDVDAARSAVGRLAAALGLDLAEAAAGIHRVVDETMAGAARMHAIERGRDLRRFALVATGGAGPVHAWGVARRLGIRRLVLPPSAGVASAFGMLTAPPAFDFARSLPAELAAVEWAGVRSAVREMRREGAAQLAAAGVRGADVGVGLAADVRYRGQGEGVTVALGEGLGRRPAAQVREAFEAVYVRLYGRRPPGVEPEVLTWRVRVSGPRPAIAASGAVAAPGPARKGRRAMWSEERRGFVDAEVWDRYRLAPGDEVAGPAVVEERESSAVIGEGGRGVVDAHGNLNVEVAP
ncbi:MAG TPA: hydantoinase/oxoprolinase family protein [Candidatus Dormibacteraeota bacterium]